MPDGFWTGLAVGLAAAVPATIAVTRTWFRYRRWGLVVGRTRRERWKAYREARRLDRDLTRAHDRQAAEWQTRRRP